MSQYTVEEHIDMLAKRGHSLEAQLAAARAEIAKMREALIWCSGSQDFAIGGQARAGWEKICQPLLAATDQDKPA